jgi:group I intron endonuclease
MVGPAVVLSRLNVQHLNKNKHHSKYLQRAWNLYGEQNFKFYIIEEVENCLNLIEREQFWIDNKTSNYNMCKKADSSLGLKRSEETKEKLRISHLGVKHPTWRNEQKSISQKGKSKNVSKEGREKINQAIKETWKNGRKHHHRKAILQFDLQKKLIKEWESIADAQRFFNSKSIETSLRRKNKKKKNVTALGYIWEYK